LGKYDAVVAKLPKLPVEPSDYQMKVEAAKEKYRALRTTQLVTTFADLRRKKDDLEEQEKALNLQIEAVTQLVLGAFEKEELASIKLDDGCLVFTQVEPYAGVKDKETYRAWCVSEGLEKEMHLWPSTTQALVKERLLSGLDNPPGVEAFVKTSLRIRGK